MDFMKRLFFRIALSLLIVLLLHSSSGYGATQNRSQFMFLNESNLTVWVESLSEFRSDPRCGRLFPGAINSGPTLNLRPQETPRFTVITWWVGDRDKKESAVYTQKINLESFPRPALKGIHR